MNFFVYTASVLVKKVKTVVTAAAIFRFSYSKCGRTANLAIAYWKIQIGLCPNIDGNGKEWGEDACRYNGEKGVRKTEKVVHKQQFDSVSTVSLYRNNVIP